MASYDPVGLQRISYSGTKTCAIDIICEFPYTSYTSDRAWVKKDLEGFIEAGKKPKTSLNNCVSSTNIISLNESQRGVWEELLLSVGYEKIKSFRNLRENHTIHLYIWCAQPEPNESDWDMGPEWEDEDDED